MIEADSVQANVNQNGTKTELVFDKIGDNYFLRQVWLSGSNSGSELARSRMEKSIAGDSAQVERHSVVASLKRLKP
jgi:hypothetical protein